MAVYTTYSLESGEFMFVHKGSELTETELEGQGFIEGELNTKTHYFNDGEIIARPEFTFSDSYVVAVDEDVIFPFVPEGTAIQMPGGEVVMDDSESLTWKSSVPGAFKIRFTQFPFIPKEVFVECSA